MTEKKKNKVGRPKIEIDRAEIVKLAHLQCTYEEIAAFFDVDKGTISRNYTTEVLKGRELGKMSLRRSQFKLAQTNGAVCIWLGKNYLGQKEPDSNRITDEIEIPINVDGLSDQQVNELYAKLSNKN